MSDIRSGRDFVLRDLLETIKEVYNTQDDDSKSLFGELCDGHLRMPLVDDHDGRKATWTRKLTAIANKIVNSAKSRDDCWLIRLPAGEAYPDVKLSKDGSRNKWKAHRFLRCVIRPDERSLIEDPTLAPELHLSHLCGNGMNTDGLNTACVNPYHTEWVTAKVNMSQKGCAYGACYFCPHEPKCIFCDRVTGRFLPCRNVKVPTVCTCEVPCYKRVRE